MFKITGKDIIAAIIIVGCITLISLGIDSEVKSILALVAGYYFGVKVVERKKGPGG